MTVPRNQSTAAKKARAAQKALGGKHTELLARHQPATITLTLDTHLARALESLGRHTDGTPEEIAYKTILDAEIYLCVDDDAFATNMARYEAGADKQAVYRALAEMSEHDDRPGVKPLTRSDIRVWAEAEDGGRMDWAAAGYFTQWLTCHRYALTDDSGLQTNKDVLKTALDSWFNDTE